MAFKKYFFIVCKKNMNKKILKFGNIRIDKPKFHYPENQIGIKDVDIEKILICKKVSFGKKSYKHFISYKYDNYEIKSLLNASKNKSICQKF